MRNFGVAFVAKRFEVGEVVGTGDAAVAAVRLIDVVDFETDAVCTLAFAGFAAIAVSAASGSARSGPPVVLSEGARAGIGAPGCAAFGEWVSAPATVAVAAGASERAEFNTEQFGGFRLG